MAFTQYAYDSRTVKAGADYAAYFDAPQDGTYRATGTDTNGKRYSRDYAVNSSSDFMRAWYDFSGRYALTQLWYVNADATRKLIYRKD